MVKEWNGKEFSVIDTGGYVRGSDDDVLKAKSVNK
jgi:predicted GTPase